MIDTVGFSDKMKASVGKGLTDSFKLDVNVDLVLRDSKGRVKQHEKVHNTVTSGGLEAVMDQLLASPTVGKPGWMEVGTGTPGASLLGAYVPGSRTPVSSVTRLGATVTMQCTFGAGIGTGLLTEAGVFSVATQNTGIMYVSASFGVITKEAGDSLDVVWTMTAGLLGL